MQSNSAIQFWGVKDLLVTVKLCDSTCQTCNDPNSNNCTSCTPGLYLVGTLCIITCPTLTLPALGLCVNSCPAYYFINSQNNYCEPCALGCQICTAIDNCQVWDALSNPKSLFYDKMAVWIILVMFGVFLMGVLIWFLISRCKGKTPVEEELNFNKSKGNEESNN